MPLLLLLTPADASLSHITRGRGRFPVISLIPRLPVDPSQHRSCPGAVPDLDLDLRYQQIPGPIRIPSSASASACSEVGLFPADAAVLPALLDRLGHLWELSCCRMWGNHKGPPGPAGAQAPAGAQQWEACSADRGGNVGAQQEFFTLPETFCMFAAADNPGTFTQRAATS